MEGSVSWNTKIYYRKIQNKGQNLPGESLKDTLLSKANKQWHFKITCKWFLRLFDTECNVFLRRKY